MNLATDFQCGVRRPSLLGLLAAIAVAILTLAGAAEADARVKVVAKVNPKAPATVRVAALTSSAAKQVLFYVDGRRHGVRRSFRWRYGRKGILRVRSTRPRRHRLTVAAIHRRGHVSKATRVIWLGRKHDGRRMGLGAAQQLTRPKKQSQVAEESQSTSSPLPPGVLFLGNFDNGFDDWYVQSLSQRATIFSGGSSHSSAARFEVEEGDIEPDTGSERSEVSGPTYNEGQDLYFRDAIRIPASTTMEGKWQIIQQLHEHNWGSSPGIAVFLDDGPSFRIGAGDGSPTFWESDDIEHDRWYELVYRVKLSQDPDTGFVEVWLNGERQEMVNGEYRSYGQTIQTSSTYLKAGIYRSGSHNGDSVIEHDDIVVGTSYDAVMGV